MSKKSNTKNIIITNLPAVAALVLMAAALAITLEYNFFVSLIVLVVLYFLLGVTIEIIMEKAQTKKKRENLFKQFSEGGRSNLPTARKELFGEIDTEEPVFPEDKPEDTGVDSDDLDVEKKPLATVEDEVDFDYEDETSEEIEEESEDEEDEDDYEVTDSDFFRGIVLDDAGSLADWDGMFIEPSEESLSDSESDNDEPENVEVEEISAEEFTIEDVPVEDHGITVDEEVTDDVIEDEIPEVEVESVVEAVEESETASEEFVEDVPEVIQEEASAPFDLEEDEISEEELEDTEAPFEDNQEINEELFDVLKDMGAVEEGPVDETPSDEKDARRSLFDGNDFDAKFVAGSKPSLVFSSVPDTEDDLEYIPPVEDNTNVPKKGKVQVDSQKIDELYAFKKAGKGESFFGKRKK